MRFQNSYIQQKDATFISKDTSNISIPFIQTQLLDAIDDAVFATDLYGTCLYWNKAAEHIYSFYNELDTYKDFGTILRPVFPQYKVNEILNALFNVTNISITYTMQSGNIDKIELKNDFIYDNDKNIVAIIWITKTITHSQSYKKLIVEKEAGEEPSQQETLKHLNALLNTKEKTIEKLQTELRKNKHEDNLILQNIPEYITSQNTDYTVNWGNIPVQVNSDDSREITKYPCYYIRHNRQKPCENCIMNSVLQANDIASIYKTMSNGSTWKITGIPLKENSDTISGIIEIAEDITNQLKNEAFNRMISVFLTDVSHGVRTPLNAMMGFAELLEDNTLDKETQQLYAKIINDRGNDLLQITDNIIDLLKIETNQLPKQTQKLSVNSLLDKLYYAFHEKINNYYDKIINLSVSKELSNKESKVIGDADRIYQIFYNLLDNAVNYTEHGDIVFGYEQKNESEFLFFVQDTGMGISSPSLHSIYESFWRSTEAMEKQETGLGLGLTITKALVKYLSGTIWAESNHDQGTTMYFLLPVERTK